MYRSLYPDAPGLHQTTNNWYAKGKQHCSAALEKCQCMRLHYRYHLDWFKRIFGFLMVLLCLGVLAWNESRAVENSQYYHEGLQSVIILRSPDEIHPENEGKLVHVSGYLDIFEPLQDPPYGVSIAAVKLKRRVQMYQWVEIKDEHEAEFPGHSAGATTYRYTREWKDKLIDSSKFAKKDYQNPQSFPIQCQIRTSKEVHLGKFKLGAELKEKFNNFIQFTSAERPDNQDTKMHMGLYYHSSDIWNPTVGDIRIQFSFAGPADSFISVIAKQSGQELRPYETDSGKEMAFIHEGKRSHLEILTKEHSALTSYCWIFRSLTWLFTVFGTSMASKTFAMMNRRNPVVQNLLSVGPGKFSIVFATFLCLSTIGSMWFHHKPLFSVLLVTFSCSLLLYYALVRSDNNDPNEGEDIGSGIGRLSYRKNYLPRYLKD